MTCIVWLKRDLRLADHEPLYRALKTSNRVLLLYTLEPFLLADPHYSERHFIFIKQSLTDINERLKPYNSEVLVVHEYIVSVLARLLKTIGTFQLFSHQETGLECTYKRDKQWRHGADNRL
jgi:deoxyribodipyrimidine photo-lyase